MRRTSNQGPRKEVSQEQGVPTASNAPDPSSHLAQKHGCRDGPRQSVLIGRPPSRPRNRRRGLRARSGGSPAPPGPRERGVARISVSRHAAGAQRTFAGRMCKDARSSISGAGPGRKAAVAPELQAGKGSVTRRGCTITRGPRRPPSRSGRRCRSRSLVFAYRHRRHHHRHHYRHHNHYQ